jgi:hypothetical protein
MHYADRDCFASLAMTFLTLSQPRRSRAYRGINAPAYPRINARAMTASGHRFARNDLKTI